MSWYNIFPHTLYKQALLMDGKLIDWRIGVCVSCGSNPCKCKSSLESKPQTISQRDTLIAIDKENKKELDIRNKYFRGKKK